MTQREKTEIIKKAALEAGAEIRENEPLSRHTTVRTGGECDLMIFAKDSPSAARLVLECRRIGLYCMILGNGSNCLFEDGGFRGAVIVPAANSGEITSDGGVVTASACVPLISVCRYAKEKSLSGMEFAYGIPGTVGGAVYMNAGAYGGDMYGIIESVEAMGPDGEVRTYRRDDLGLGYRTSRFEKTGEIILSASFMLAPGDGEEISRKMEELMARRKSRQPLEYPSFGSAFKRPEGTYAGLVIEQSGLKGVREGGAQISEKHANFIVNLGGATSADIIRLIERARKEAKEKTGYTLEPEVRLIPGTKQGEEV